MYICPECLKEFNTEDTIRNHFLACWKEKHPYHPSKSAPRGKDVVVRQVNEDVMNFFNSFNEVK